MSAIIGMQIGKEVCDALGLDVKGTVSIDLHIKGDEVVTASIVRNVQEAEAKRLVKVLEQYELHRKTEDVTALGSDVANYA